MNDELSACCSPSAGKRPSSEVVPAKEGAKASTGEMSFVPGGAFRMGTEDEAGFPSDGEGPVRPVVVRPFYVDLCAVANAKFLAFADATNYRTEAERFGWSFVFGGLLPEGLDPDQAVRDAESIVRRSEGGA